MIKNMEKIELSRWWIEHIRDHLFGMGDLPPGPLGDWAFIFREQLTDILNRPPEVSLDSGVTIFGIPESYS